MSVKTAAFLNKFAIEDIIAQLDDKTKSNYTKDYSSYVPEEVPCLVQLGFKLFNSKMSSLIF